MYKFGFKKNKYWFTLIELIVVIAIISILAIWAFVVVNKWILKSRNSARLADVNTIKQSINMYWLKYSKFPDPTESFPIEDMSWNIIAYQWTFGSGVVVSWISLTNTPLDPQTKDPYLYTKIVYPKPGFEVWVILESSDEVAYISNITYAALIFRVPYIISQYQWRYYDKSWNAKFPKPVSFFNKWRNKFLKKSHLWAGAENVKIKIDLSKLVAKKVTKSKVAWVDVWWDYIVPQPNTVTFSGSLVIWSTWDFTTALPDILSGWHTPSAICWNDIQETWEQCDDGDLNNSDGCNSVCEIEPHECWNNILETWGSEQCDDDNLIDWDGCNSTCQLEPIVCWDNVIEWAEQCDDGNEADLDGCSSTCTLEEPTVNGLAANPNPVVVNLSTSIDATTQSWAKYILYDDWDDNIELTNLPNGTTFTANPTYSTIWTKTVRVKVENAYTWVVATWVTIRPFHESTVNIDVINQPANCWNNVVEEWEQCDGDWDGCSSSCQLEQPTVTITATPNSFIGNLPFTPTITGSTENWASFSYYDDWNWNTSTVDLSSPFQSPTYTTTWTKTVIIWAENNYPWIISTWVTLPTWAATFDINVQWLPECVFGSTTFDNCNL